MKPYLQGKPDKNSHSSNQFEQNQLPLVLPFASLDRTMLALVGGKAANLGEMTQAGLPVPPGFCLTTKAYALVAKQANLDVILNRHHLDGSNDDTASLNALAAKAGESLMATAIPVEIVEAVTTAYDQLGKGQALPVAVRSSATAEDLPFASFAGQQDTYLNVVGLEPLLEAIQHCWASLWTQRAVNYRTSNGIDQAEVQLAVVVQQMVEAQVAGVMFTANPVTGKRRQVVIDANPGLGEAVVSGAVNPDHFVVNLSTTTKDKEIVERRLGDKNLVIEGVAGGGTRRFERSNSSREEACLSDEQIYALAELGAKVEAYYDTPQDIEWALDQAGMLWLTQSRPITTLYPLPKEAPQTDAVLSVYFSVNVAQGVYRPFTPMGLSIFKLIGSSIANFLGMPPQDLLAGPPAMVEAGQRLFFDLTTPLRSSLGRYLAKSGLNVMETRAGLLLEPLFADPRLSIRKPARLVLLRTFGLAMLRSRFPLYLAQALFLPKAARQRVKRMEEFIRRESQLGPEVTAAERLAKVEALFMRNIPHIIPRIIPLMVVGLGASALAGKLLGKLATPQERQVVLRGLPYNPTTQMNLALWKLAQKLKKEAGLVQLLAETTPSELTEKYREGKLPAVLQQGLAEFLKIYGHRGVAEIDLGLPRWSEDPTHLLGVLANYLQVNDPEQAADLQFERSATEAEAMVKELVERASRQNWWRGKLVSLCLSRTRALAGIREMPKYYAVLQMALARSILWPVGAELVQLERLSEAEDIFFLTLGEAKLGLDGQDFRAEVVKRRTSYEQELKRRQIPRFLLSDGTQPTPVARYHNGLATPATASRANSLSGTPASPGVVRAKARVILEPNGAKLEPGEILVAPSTDPGWTPLFMTAGGLVMEMGGAMSHGAVVAREYGIPAVVGVAGATESIRTGQIITLDATNGTVSLE